VSFPPPFSPRVVAQGDLDEDGEDRLKQLFLVRKIYNNMLSRRLRDDQRRTDRLSNAYQRIRTATGLDDVAAIIHKYQTRDSTVATLQAQMRAARDRVDALSSERRTLVWALDEAQTLGASALESRALYNSVEDYDRRMAEAGRRVRESRERLNRLSVVLEECRACMVKMLDRVGVHPGHIVGVVAGTAGAPPPDSPTKTALAAAREGAGSAVDGGFGGPDGMATAGAADDGSGGAVGAAAAAAAAAAGDGATGSTLPGRRRASFNGGSGSGAATGAAAAAASTLRTAGRPVTPGVGSGRGMEGVEPSAADPTAALAARLGVKVVQPEALEHALSQLEQRVSQLLAHLAAVFEREEAAYASNAKSKGGKGRRGGPPTVGGGSLVGGASRSAVAALETTATAVTESDAAAHRMSVAALSDKASMRVFQRMMTLQPDTSDRNVRINARAPSPEPSMTVLNAASALAAARSEAAAAAAAAAVGGGAGGGAGTAADEVHTAMHKSAADLSKLLHGSGAGSVVDRVSLKRLSAMVAASMGGSGGPPGSRRPAGAGTTLRYAATGGVTVAGVGGSGDGGISPRAPGSAVGGGLASPRG